MTDTTDHPSEAALLRTVQKEVWNERDAGKREEAIARYYAEDASLVESDNEANGRQAISAAVGGLLEAMGPAFAFEPVGNASGHHGRAVAPWRGGPGPGGITVTGSDMVKIDGGQIAEHFVFIDAPAS